MPIGDPTPSPRRSLRPAVRVACALLAGLAFAASAMTADAGVCTSWVDYVLPYSPTFGAYNPNNPGVVPISQAEIVTEVSTGPMAYNTGISAGEGVVIQILASDGAPVDIYSVIYSTNMLNVCGLPCETSGILKVFTLNNPDTVSCYVDGQPAWYAVKGICATTGSSVLQYHSPCDGQLGWQSSDEEISRWVSPAFNGNGPCP